VVADVIAQLLVSVLADTVFRWAASTGHAFEAELLGYMERKGLAPRPEGKPPAR
jgi:hypothetical protein